MYVTVTQGWASFSHVLGSLFERWEQLKAGSLQSEEKLTVLKVRIAWEGNNGVSIYWRQDISNWLLNGLLWSWDHLIWHDGLSLHRVQYKECIEPFWTYCSFLALQQLSISSVLSFWTMWMMQLFICQIDIGRCQLEIAAPGIGSYYIVLYSIP